MLVQDFWNHSVSDSHLNVGADCECVKTAGRMAEENPKVFVPQQFENEANPMVGWRLLRSPLCR